MKKNRFLSVLLVIVFVSLPLLQFGCSSKKSSTSSSQPYAGTTIKWATIAGFYTDWTAKLAAQFTQQTGINVQIVQIDNSVMREKEAVELSSHSGAYDIVTVHHLDKAGWANAGWIVPLDPYIQKYNMQDDVNALVPVMRKLIAQYQGHIYSLPYYSYSMGMVVRQDLFDDPGEQAAYQAKYGVPLTVPTTWDQYKQVADFFTRPAGATLKGQTLTAPFYGTGLMAGRFTTQVDDDLTFLWGYGGDVLDSNYKSVIDSPQNIAALKMYISLLDNDTPPACHTASYDDVIAMMQNGQIAMMPMYMDQWINIAKADTKTAGANVMPYEMPTGKSFIGAFGLGICADSKNKDAAFQFIQFLESKQEQEAFCQGGGNSCRMDVLEEPQFNTQSDFPINGQFKTFLKIYQDQADASYTFLTDPAAGPIYNEMVVEYNEAINHQLTPEQALSTLSQKIDAIQAPFMSAVQKQSNS